MEQNKKREKVNYKEKTKERRRKKEDKTLIL